MAKAKVKNPRVPRTRAGGTWTEAQFFNWIRGALRRAATRWPVKFHVLNEAKYVVEGQRHRFEYECAGCGEGFKGSDVEVDHVVPAGSLLSFDDIPAFVERLFCEADGLQVLCKGCHRAKTNAEKDARKELKDG